MLLGHGANASVPRMGKPTPSELEVVKFLAQGLTHPKIGERLFISRSTVKNHLGHVFDKLGVTTRAELAAEATHIR
jgi:DNA-binding NarL/FixJ family response regulator